MNANYWESFLAKNPTAIAALMGGTIGGTVGGIFSDEGAAGRGALQGALLGGIGGGLSGKFMHSGANRLQQLVPTPQSALTFGAVGGGALGGVLGKRSLSPWVVHHLQQQGYDDKEASMATEPTQEKKAAIEKEAELNNAFDFGMRVFFQEQGIDRAELIKAANAAGAKVDDASLAEATILWVSELQEKK